MSLLSHPAMFARLLAAVLLATLLVALSVSSAGSIELPPDVVRYEGGDMPHGMSVDCVLQAFDVCSGWLWVFSESEGAVWGSILNPHDCPVGCNTTRRVKEIGACSRRPMFR